MFWRLAGARRRKVADAEESGDGAACAEFRGDHADDPDWESWVEERLRETERMISGGGWRL